MYVSVTVQLECDEDKGEFLEKLEQIVTAHRNSSKALQHNHSDSDTAPSKASKRRVKRRKRVMLRCSADDDSGDDDPRRAPYLYKAVPLLEIPENFSE